MSKYFSLLINQRAFLAIQNGKKTVEIRANKNSKKANYAEIDSGDVIRFVNEENHKNFECIVKRKTLYPSIEALLKEEEKQTLPHLIGTSAIQFITTSNITIHTLDIMKRVYLNLFSCKEFDTDVVVEFSKKWFDGTVVNKQTIRRI